MLTDAQIKSKLAKAKGWKRADVGGKPGIAKTFARKNFLDGLGFVTHVAVLAEKANHHPDVLLTWPKVTMALTTHSAGGLTDKDFALAAEIDKGGIMTEAPVATTPAVPAGETAPAGPQPIENARIMVTGASGFVGRHVVRELIARGHHPVCLVRDRTVFGEQMRSLPANRFESVAGSLSSQDALTAAMKDAAAVIHLVGIIQERRTKGQTFERVHVEGTKRVLDAAGKAGARRFIHMSALGARLHAPSEYHRTKWAAESAVRSSGLDYTIFRPSIIHGPDGEFMQMMRTFVCDAMVTSFGFLPSPFPVIPYFGKGENKLQPVDVRDVATCFVGALARPDTIGKSFDLGGPEALTWKQLYQTCKDLIPCAKKWKPIVSIPVWKAKLMAKTVMKLPVLPMALRFNEGQVAMSQEDSICDPRPAEAAFGITLRDFRTELKQYAPLIT